MESHIWGIFSITVVIIGSLIAIVYKNLGARMDEIVARMEKSTVLSQAGLQAGLDLKVDKAEYKIVREWEKDVFNGMRLTIKELKDENNAAHEAIMLEIKRDK